ncbi:hypothetical protein [Achromobacter kerstersii]|uniref:hypothetical protein n=1 Tax=Achromobacter kerstersii TaxID=1353890 RepID=UPI0012E29F25|nr:hypothetical protein [Achromobacter kerstersii]
MSIQKLFRIAIALFLITGPSSAFARWQASVTWQIGPGPSTYTGIGDSQPEALGAARSTCWQAQPLDDWKNFCKNNPTRVEYSQLPEGSYIKSCGGCRVVDNKLVCDYCKPVIERRELDLAVCTGDSINHIENCHGDLRCTGCPK